MSRSANTARAVATALKSWKALRYKVKALLSGATVGESESNRL